MTRQAWSVAPEVRDAFGDGWAVVHRKHKPRQQQVGPGIADGDELFVVLEGELEIFGGRRWHAAPPRSFAFFRQGEKYGIRHRKGHRGGAHIVNVLFRAPKDFVTDARHAVLRLSAPWFRRFLDLESACDYDARGQRVLTNDDVLAFMERLYRAAAVSGPHARKKEEPRRPDTGAEWMETWSRAEDVIRERAAQGLSVEELARAVNVSPTQLRRVFMSARGISPKAALTRYRIEQARALLASGRFNITQVADNVGYSTLQRFSAAFKAATGESPLAFARRH